MGCAATWTTLVLLAGWPVYARGATPMTARGRVVEASTGEPIHIDGVTVGPGDDVIADWSGVVFIASVQAARVIETAETLAAAEARMAEAVRAGAPVEDVMDASYESLLGRPSELG